MRDSATISPNASARRTRLQELGVQLAGDSHETSRPGVFAAGDCRRGQSLIVRAAEAVDVYLEQLGDRANGGIGLHRRSVPNAAA